MENNIKFIDYSGRYPDFCGGLLKIEIDNIAYALRYAIKPGGCDNGYKKHAPWKVLINELPPKIRKYANEIEKLVNKNIGYGCCGGCRENRIEKIK